MKNAAPLWLPQSRGKHEEDGRARSHSNANMLHLTHTLRSSVHTILGSRIQTTLRSLIRIEEPITFNTEGVFIMGPTVQQKEVGEEH
jgi:hypothetical protein